MMKKLFYFLIPFLTFFSIQVVNADSGFFTNKAPSKVQYLIGGSNWANYTTSPTSAWGFSGWNIGSVDNISGLTTTNTRFYFNNQDWFSGKNWSVDFQIMTESESYRDYFVDHIPDVFALTDYGAILCTVSPVAYGSGQGNLLDIKCSGQSTTTLGFQLNWKRWAINSSVDLAIRSDWSNYITDLDNSSIIDSINSSNQNVINNANQNQSQTNSRLDEINKGQNDINNSINNSDTSSSQSKLEDINNNFKEDISKSPISDLITLPLKLLTAFNNKLSANQVCTPYDMGTIFGIHWLQLPCINPPDYLGSALWATIDMISTALLLWAIAHKMVKVYISITSVDGQFVTKIISQTGGML